MYTVYFKKNKQIAKLYGSLTKAGIKLFPVVSLRNTRRFNKRKTFQAKNRLVRLADTLVANLTKAKSTENTNLNRQYSFINFWHFWLAMLR